VGSQSWKALSDRSRLLQFFWQVFFWESLEVTFGAIAFHELVVTDLERRNVGWR